MAQKLESNRRNARRSTGPRSAAGKAASARNALRHGILSRSPVIEGAESQAEWQEHLNATVSALEPVGYLELTLARRIALQTWRLERHRRYEMALARERMAAIDEPGGVDSIVEAALNGFLKASRDREAFETITKMEPFETVAAPIAIRILRRIAEVNGLELDEADLAVEGGVAATDNPEAARWPASEVVRLATEIAAQGGMHPGPTLMLSMNSATHGLDARGARLRELREQRLLPEGRDLEVLQRYEAGLERSLFRTMHELERLQAHRNGGEVPVPAVLDLTVESGSTAA